MPARAANPAGLDRFDRALAAIPPPGGNGCHPALLSAANVGRAAGLTAGEVAEALAGAVPHGTRRVSGREIEEAVAKAFHHSPRAWTARAPERPRFHQSAQRRIIEKGTPGPDLDELCCRSPVPLDWPPHEDSWRLLEALYSPEDRVYIGHGREALDGQAVAVRPASEWIALLRALSPAGLCDAWRYIIPNTLTGITAPTSTGNESMRGDANVARYAVAVAEFDTLPVAEQLAFWRGLAVPVVALIESGGKSVHAWLRVNVTDAAGWTERVKGKLYRDALVPLGVDPACSNPSRLSRLPGMLRTETNRWQRLLWLSPEGEPIR